MNGICKNCFKLVNRLQVGVLSVGILFGLSLGILLSVTLSSAQAIELERLEESQMLFYTIHGQFEQVKDQVNVYQSPRGWGYQTIQQYDDRIEYTGYGADAIYYTYTTWLPIIDISSTTPIIDITPTNESGGTLGSGDNNIPLEM